jgi:hypothetical protein
MKHAPRKRKRRFLYALALVEPLAMWLRGYPVGGNLVVRCRRGHLWRIQWCPVGRHWSIVTPVRPSELPEAEERSARERRDLPLP